MGAKNKGKKPKKKAKAAAKNDEGAVDIVQRPSLMEPWTWLPDWFDHLRPMGGRHMPDLFTEMTLVDSIRVEERREDGTVIIRAEMPGLDPDKDIDVTMTDGKLTISARREQREETKTDDSFRTEFRYGSFERTRTVPPGTKLEEIKATYKDGILEVRVPVDESEEARARIPITRNQ